mgnify:CR=1 FL=1
MAYIPLLQDDHCWFLAVDFDKSDWQSVVTAFRRACTAWEIPCAVERSRSGNGAHVWLFFEQPIPARDARCLGIALLDKAMEQHAGLSFDSYDRLFPNQDHRPTGGFGNLIALPLQHDPRQRGNTAFIDANFAPYPYQWAYLSSLQRLSLTQATACLEHLDTDKGTHASDLKPWEKGLPVSTTAIANCPANVALTLANRIYIPHEGLPQVLLARLKRLASFSNPAFFQAQRLRLSTQGTPRYICLAHVEQGYLSLPRGCLEETWALLREQAITVEMEDLRKSGTTLPDLTFNGTLRKDQTRAVNALAQHELGVLHAPTAFGKTVTAIGLIQRRKVNTLILVHSRQLLDQWQERLNAFLSGAAVGMIGGGKHKPSGEIDVATYQSLINRSDNSVSPNMPAGSTARLTARSA